jgi:hypothetical protein
MVANTRATWKALDIQPFEVTDPAYAFVNEGRWIASCPDPHCSGAEFVREGHPLLCASCGGVSQVVWPDDVEGIERHLSKRRHRKNQNWNVGEPVEALEVENADRGL